MPTLPALACTCLQVDRHLDNLQQEFDEQRDLAAQVRGGRQGQAGAGRAGRAGGGRRVRRGQEG